MRGLGETGECGSETRVTDRRDRTESTCLRDSRACAFSYDLNIYPLVIVVYVPYVMHATLQ